MKNIFQLVFCVILTWNGIHAGGQSFLHLTSSDGLPDNHVRFVYQDSSGYIYTGTRNGMCRYDGYVFSTAVCRDTTQPPPREFAAMIQTRHGFFTVAATGIYAYDRKNNSLHLQKKLQLLDEACFSEFNHTIFCGNSSGLFMYDTISGKWIESNQYVAGIDQIHVRSMLITASGDLLIGTNKGLFRYDQRMQLVEGRTGTDPLLHDVNGLVQDHNGNIWVSTFNNVYGYDSLYNRIGDFRDVFAGEHIRCTTLDHAQRIWVGGEFGIVILDPVDGKKQAVYRDIGREQGLNDNAVYSLYRDAADNVWVGTYFGGINLWNADFDKFSVIFPGEGEKNTSGKVVREMLEDASGNLWLALEDGGLNYLDASSGSVTRFFYQGDNDYKNIHAIVLEEDLLWLGSFNSGLECYRIDFTGRVPRLRQVASYLPDEMVFDIEKDRYGNIYAGSVGQVYKLERSSGMLSPVHASAFSTLIIYTLEILPDETLLLGTLRNGLYHFNPANQIATSFSVQEAFPGMQTISHIHGTEDDGYLIACSDGLYNYQEGAHRLTRLLRTPGNSEFRSVLPDPVSGYWISTTNGLLYADPDQNLVKKFNRYDGLPENQFNFNSAYISSAGRYYFGSYNGLISFIPAEMKLLTNNIPPVSFTGYTLLGEDRTTLESYFMDNTQNELRLKPYQLFISIEFSTLGFSRTQNVDYEFRMAGESVRWDRMENSRTLTLTNLGKGWHTLEVRAAMDGLVSPEISTLRIYRQPAIWQTVYAYIFYMLVLAALFLLVRRDYLRRQHARHTLAIERFEKENQKKLNDQKMRFFLNISHEFRTPLTIIGGTISNILNKFSVEKELKKKLDIIQNTSEDLNKLVNDFLEYGRLESGFKPIELKKGPVMLFIRKACDMFDNWAEVNQLVYHKEIEDNREMAFFDQFRLERVIYNLLSNAFKFNKSHGEVKVQARVHQSEESWLELLVSDTGSGIDKAALARLRTKFEDADTSGINEKGIGLTYIAGLVRQMGGRINVESEPGKGTVFSVRLPMLLSASEYNSDLSRMEPTFAKPEQEEPQEEETETSMLVRNENKPHILVIDDHADLLEMLSDALRPEFNVTVSGNPLKALELVRREDFGLVICDIMMPGMNGFEVIERIHSDILTSHIPILVLTAAADKGIEMKGYRKGAVSYLAKPFRVEELKVKINSVLSFRRELIRRYSTGNELPAEKIAHTVKDEAFLKEATRVVHENMEDAGFDVDRFCAEMKISRTLLHNKLKHITGLSTTEFIRTIRLKKAWVYLKKGDFTVAEVAYKCGFNDPNYFSKCFRKMYQVFPSRLKG